ncbi:arylsulfatase [Stieleria sp. JC731]|uniref:sulfatase family protein n=1 Tax=Pirellulaceae TaxID=2691357 RepID=UPI001E42E7D3|nr:arylsulfatase [Stieleria sp. JC731]MCC9601248.1 arylsulfatase [Stieleria sp. JC731]
MSLRFLPSGFHRSASLPALAILAVLTCFNDARILHAQERDPNIIVIMADDLGYGDVSCYGATELETPNIDKLANGGMRFTQGYCNASTCTPTRFSFLTGKYAFRQPGAGIAPPNATSLIQPGTDTVASLLKNAGYKTGVVGKWHLGLGEGDAPDWNGALKPGPLEIGFDYCYLLPTTNDRVPSVYVENHHVVNLDPADPLWVGNKSPSDDHPLGSDPEVRKTLKMDWSHGHNQTVHNGIGRIGFYTGGHQARWRDEDLADAWVEKSVAFIEKHQAEPFFLFFASHDLHVPRMPHERFQGKTKLGFRGDSIVQLDWCVGELTKTLEKLGIDQNTMIVFCSDNGPVLDDGYQDGAIEQLHEHQPSGIYRGGKYSIYEGGTRTPLITYWPGTIKPGESDKIVCTVDLPASLAALVDQPLPANACPDSFNVIDALLGKPNAEGRDHLLQQPNKGPTLALRVGDWKVLSYATAQAKKHLTYEKGPGKYELYNLANDPSEKDNLAESHPEKLKELLEKLESIKDAGHSRPNWSDAVSSR